MPNPVMFEYIGKYQCKASHICEAIMDDYGRCLTLGRDKNPTRETYIAFIYESKLHIALHSHDKLALVDSINVGKSSTFKWIAGFYWADSDNKRLLDLSI